MRLFADGSIAYREIKKNTCDYALLQQDLASLCEWAETWLVFTSDGVGVRVVIRSVELMIYWKQRSDSAYDSVASENQPLEITEKVVPLSYNCLMNDIVMAK